MKFQCQNFLEKDKYTTQANLFSTEMVVIGLNGRIYVIPVTNTAPLQYTKAKWTKDEVK